MRRPIALLALLSLYLPTNAEAAIVAKAMVQVGPVETEAIGVVASGSQILVFGNRETNGFAQLLNGPTVELQGGVESFVSAATVDSEGNFILVGAGANPIVGTLPPINEVLNPDNVVPDPISSSKSDPINLWYWKLNLAGEIIDSASMLMPSATIPTAVLADKFGMTIAGTTFTDPGNSGFVLNWNSKPTLIGKSSTQVFAIARTADGGVNAVGQSAETLLGKPLRGKVDGFLARVSNNKVTLIQRSSESKANRAWRSTTANLLLGGYSNSAAAITKFNNNFLPTWTDRYPSNGSALTASVGKISYGALLSTGAIKALPSWKRKGSVLLLQFDGKGVITGAYFANTSSLTALTANSVLGPVVLAGGFLYRINLG
ncbi:MAG: hypothetical protein ACKO8C_00205 [Candidatus Nanopelagicaceae bacterium]